MPKRVLVIRAGQLGDTAYASSIIEPLRHHFGENVIIDWVAKRGIGNIFKEDPRIRNIFEIKSRRTPFLLNTPKLRIILYSWQWPYDLVVNLETGSIFNSVVRVIRAKKKIGMPYKFFAEPPESHAVDNLKLIYQSFLDNTDLEYASPSLIGTEPDKVRREFNLPNKYFVLVPANSHLDKSSPINHRAWPIEHWQELMQLMSDEGLQGVIIGGKGESEFFKRFSTLPKNIISLVGQTNFPQLIGLIQGARGVITTDTGPAHIAAAVNTSVYALIGPTNYKRTGPYKTQENQVVILNDNLPCSPCYHTARLKNCSDNLCMQAIKPSDVMDKIFSAYLNM